MVIILRGTSGSGKSRLATLLSTTDFHRERGINDWTVMTQAMAYVEQLWNAIIKSEHTLYNLSSDNHLMVDGKYLFDKKFLSTAHQACLRDFYHVVIDPKAVIIVDNTNCTLEELVPYAAFAKAFGHELQIITLVTDTLTAWKRNQHEVPFATVVQQAYKLQNSIANWPSWYPQQIFPE